MKGAAKSWKASSDPLFRGDRADGVGTPVPGANASIVRHILFLEGAGRETPYLSTTESTAVADRFAGNGKVWQTHAPHAITNGVGHLSRTELVDLLVGKGKGRAKWRSAFEVMQARKYVEQHLEHLLDFAKQGHLSIDDLRALVARVFAGGGS